MLVISRNVPSKAPPDLVTEKRIKTSEDRKKEATLNPQSGLSGI